MSAKNSGFADEIFKMDSALEFFGNNLIDDNFQADFFARAREYRYGGS